ncbi:MAG: type II toxin-antitoxin system HicB family antitoxin, partial [Saezia sp.]
DVPMPSSIEVYLNKREFQGHTVGYIDIDITPYLGTTEKINVTLPSQLITHIDAFVKTHKVKSRSTFLAEAAKEKLAHS